MTLRIGRVSQAESGPTWSAPSATPRQAEADSRREAAAERRRVREHEIVAATRQLFDERGVRDAQIEDIAAAVGINRAIIYRHFTGKEEIFALTLVGYLDELAARLSQVRVGTPEEQLRAMVTAFCGYGIDYPAFVDCAQALMRRTGPELLDEISPEALYRLGRGIVGCLRHVRLTLEEGRASGDFEFDDPVLLVNSLYASSLGALQLARVGLLVREEPTGEPAVGRVAPERIRDFLIRAALGTVRPGPR